MHLLDANTAAGKRCEPSRLDGSRLPGPKRPNGLPVSKPGLGSWVPYRVIAVWWKVVARSNRESWRCMCQYSWRRIARLECSLGNVGDARSRIFARIPIYNYTSARPKRECLENKGREFLCLARCKAIVLVSFGAVGCAAAREIG